MLPNMTVVGMSFSVIDVPVLFLHSGHELRTIAHAVGGCSFKCLFSKPKNNKTYALKIFPGVFSVLLTRVDTFYYTSICGSNMIMA